jgi:hypothetical protein
LILDADSGKIVQIDSPQSGAFLIIILFYETALIIYFWAQGIAVVCSLAKSVRLD